MGRTDLRGVEAQARALVPRPVLTLTAPCRSQTPLPGNMDVAGLTTGFVSSNLEKRPTINVLASLACRTKWCLRNPSVSDKFKAHDKKSKFRSPEFEVSKGRR